MDSNKNVLDTWVEAQSKAVNNIVETSKKVQDSFMKGNLMEETTDIYKNWLNNQQSIVSETINGQHAAQSTGSQNGSNGNQAADMFNNWMNAQTQFAKTWMESMSRMMPAQQNNGFNPMEMLGQANQFYQQWNSLFSNVLNQTNGQMGAFKNMMPNMTDMNNSFSQMLSSNQVFMKMFEMWQPMMQQLQKNMENVQRNGNQAADLMKAFSPDKFREVMDSVFQFSSADKFKDLFEQITRFTHRLQDQNHGLQQQWMEQVKQMGNMMPQNASLISNSVFQNPFMKHMEHAFAPLAHLMPGGKEKEAFESWNQLKDKVATYWSKYSDMQYIIYTTGQRAMEKVMEDSMAAMRENNGKPADFKDFYNQWMNTTEKMMIDTFGGDEFSSVQGELLTVGAEIKRVLENQMERYMEGLPVVPRSEADEMAQSIHDLKARVRSLEKELRKAKAGNEPEEKTTRKAVSKK